MAVGAGENDVQLQSLSSMQDQLLMCAPGSRNWGNRAAAYLEAGEAGKCVEDCDAALKCLDKSESGSGSGSGSRSESDQPLRAKLLNRKAKALAQTGDLQGAVASYEVRSARFRCSADASTTRAESVDRPAVCLADSALHAPQHAIFKAYLAVRYLSPGHRIARLSAIRYLRIEYGIARPIIRASCAFCFPRVEFACSTLTLSMVLPGIEQSGAVGCDREAETGGDDSLAPEGEPNLLDRELCLFLFDHGTGW